MRSNSMSKGTTKLGKKTTVPWAGAEKMLINPEDNSRSSMETGRGGELVY